MLRFLEASEEIRSIASQVLCGNDIRNKVPFYWLRGFWNDIRSLFSKDMRDPLLLLRNPSIHWDHVGTHGILYRLEGENGASITFYVFPDNDEVRVTFFRSRVANDVEDIVFTMKVVVANTDLMSEFRFEDVKLPNGTYGVEGRLKLPSTKTQTQAMEA